MKKTAAALILALCLLLSAAAGTAEAKNTVLVANGAEAGEIRLCFFEEAPNVPYLGIREYAEKILGIPLLAETGENGVITLRSGYAILPPAPSPRRTGSGSSRRKCPWRVRL